MTTIANFRKKIRTEEMGTVAYSGAKGVIELTDATVAKILLTCSIFYIASLALIAFALFVAKMMVN